MATARSMSFQRQTSLAALFLVFAGALRDEIRGDKAVGIWLAEKPTTFPAQFNHGLPFFSKPQLDANLTGKVLPWGRSVEGEDAGDWIKFGTVPESYLPKMTNDTKTVMLVQLAGEQWNCEDGDWKGQTTVVSKTRTQEGWNMLITESGREIPQHREPRFLCIRADVLPHTLLTDKKTIAVVGCGIAGIVTSLELALRDDVGKVVVLDREEACAKGTSGRIAAEMMFYNFERDLFNKGDKIKLWNQQNYEWVFNAIKVWNQQGSANIKGGALPSMWSLFREKRAALGKQITVSCANVGKCKNEIWFKWSNQYGLPIVKGTTRKDVKSGYVLAGITGVFPDDLWKILVRAPSLVDRLVKAKIKQGANLLLVRVTGKEKADLRVLEAYQAQFFGAAAERLKSLIRSYPELCEAVITPFCCDPAVTNIQINEDDWGYSCNPAGATPMNNAGMGMAEVFMTTATAAHAQAKGGPDNPTEMEIWDPETTRRMLPTYLGRSRKFGDGEDPVFGAAVNRHRSGYVRTEDLGRVFENIMIARGHEIWRNRELKRIHVQDDFLLVTETYSVIHHWQVVNQVKTFAGVEYKSAYQHDVFHGLVLCTGAAPEVVNSIDKDIHRQLLPALGNIVVSPANVVPQSESRIGVVLEEFHMYLRSTKDRRLAVGGGLWIVAPSSAARAVRSLPYKQAEHTLGEIWGGTGDDYMRQSKVGKWLVAQRGTLKMGGARPLSCFDNFPLIKLHPYAPIVINTGGGVNGFSISWKSGQIAADLVLQRHVDEDQTGEPWVTAAWSWVSPKPSGWHVNVPMRVLVDTTIYESKETTSKKVETIPKDGIVVGYRDETGEWLVIDEAFGPRTAYMKANHATQGSTWEWAVWRVKTRVTFYDKHSLSDKTWDAGDMFFGSKAMTRRDLELKKLALGPELGLIEIWNDPNKKQQAGVISEGYVEPCNDSTACSTFVEWAAEAKLDG